MMHGIDERKRWLALIVLCMGGAVVSAVPLSLIMNLFTSPANRSQGGGRSHVLTRSPGSERQRSRPSASNTRRRGVDAPRHEKAA